MTVTVTEKAARADAKSDLQAAIEWSTSLCVRLLMRAVKQVLWMVSLGVLLGCKSSPPPPVIIAVPECSRAPVPVGEPVAARGPAAPAATPPASPPSQALQGIIDGAPFIGRAAVLVRPNTTGRGCSTALTGTNHCSTATDGYDFVTSTLLITEVTGTCADFEARHSPDGRLGRSVEIGIQATWPVSAQTSLGTEVNDPRRDHVSAGLLRPGNSPIARVKGDGLIGHGTVTFVSATKDDGRVAVDVKTHGPDFVRGEIPFIVCYPRSSR